MNHLLSLVGIVIVIPVCCTGGCSDSDSNTESNVPNCDEINYHVNQEYPDTIPSRENNSEELATCTPRDLFETPPNYQDLGNELDECHLSEECTEQPEGYCYKSPSNYNEPTKCYYGRFDCLVDKENDACQLNSDCTEKSNGYCYSRFENYCKCFYQDCASDVDCASDEICVCSPNEHNRVCVKSCKSDEECGTGQRCQLAGRIICYYVEHGVMGYRCSSENDECKNDCDCALSSVGPYAVCVFSETAGHFVCEKTSDVACE